MIAFENEKLLPIIQNISTRNYDILKLKYLTKISPPPMEPKANRICSQILAIRHSSSPIIMDATIEVQLPIAYTRLLRLMHLQLANLSVANNSFTNDRNLFEYMFQFDSGLDEPIERSNDQTFMVITNGELEMIADPTNSHEIGRDLLINDQHILLNEYRMARFKRDLFRKWLNSNAYELVFSQLAKSSVDNTNQYRVINWTTESKNLNCNLTGVYVNWHPNVSIAHADLFKTYVSLSCVLNFSSNLTFVAVRHRSDSLSPIKEPPELSTMELFFRLYATSFKLDLESADLNTIDSIIHSLHIKYRFFEYRCIYLFSAIVVIFLLSNVVVYTFLHSRLLMPRSFYHVLINKWLAISALISVYAIGSIQIHLPILCFLTATFTHYLILASFSWYALFFYVLYQKLSILQKRNFNLIFNLDKKSAVPSPAKKFDDYNDLDENQNGTVQIIFLLLDRRNSEFYLC